MGEIKKYHQLVADVVDKAASQLYKPLAKIAGAVANHVADTINADDPYKLLEWEDQLRATVTGVKAATVGLSDKPLVAAEVSDLTGRIKELLFGLDRDVNVMGELEKKSLGEFQHYLNNLLKKQRDILWSIGGIANMEIAVRITYALEHNLSGQVIEALRPIAAASGKPDQLDSANELWRAAQLFGKVSDNPAIRKLQRLTDEDNRDVKSKLRIKPGDANAYLELRQLLPAIHNELGIAQVQHPLAEFVKRLPLLGLEQWRSLQVFDGYAVKLAALLDKTGNRNPTVLYPASGNHYAPLQTMMRLIDLGKADSVTMIGTELEFNRGDMVRTLKALESAGVIEKIETPPPTPMSFAKDGSEQVFKLQYRGKPITVEVAIGRSGEDYFLAEHLQRADGIIIHDPDSIHASNSYKLLAEVVKIQKQAGDLKDRLVIMEGTPNANYFRGFTIGSQNMYSNPRKERPTLGVSPERIPGTYGHCKDTGMSGGVGEIFACSYGSAYVFTLNDNYFQAQIANARAPDEIFKRIYYRISVAGEIERALQQVACAAPLPKDPETKCEHWK